MWLLKKKVNFGIGVPMFNLQIILRFDEKQIVRPCDLQQLKSIGVNLLVLDNFAGWWTVIKVNERCFLKRGSMDGLKNREACLDVYPLGRWLLHVHYSDGNIDFISYDRRSGLFFLSGNSMLAIDFETIVRNIFKQKIEW